MIEGLNIVISQWVRYQEAHCAHRNLCNNTKGYPLDVVQQLPLSWGDERLLCFQESGVVIPTLDVSEPEEWTSE